MTNSATAEWIEVDPAEFNRNEKQEIDGVEVVVGMSPYDLPEGVRGWYDNELDRLVIELKYLAGEEECVQDSLGHTTIEVGRHSGRLHRILLDVQSLCGAPPEKIDHVIRCQIRHAIHEHVKRSTEKRLDHFKVAGDVIRDNQDRILAPFHSK